MMYGGRLGRILKKYPRVKCEECGTFQVQIINYLIGDAGYKCRHCKHKFTLPFDEPADHLEDLFPIGGTVK